MLTVNMLQVRNDAIVAFPVIDIRFDTAKQTVITLIFVYARFK